MALEIKFSNFLIFQISDENHAKNSCIQSSFDTLVDNARTTEAEVICSLKCISSQGFNQPSQMPYNVILPIESNFPIRSKYVFYFVFSHI